MDIPLIYPKIPDSRNCPLKKCFAFEKYDGTNLHWAWEYTFGWSAFGTRRHEYDVSTNGEALFHKENPQLEGASKIFFDQYAQPLDQFFNDNLYFKATIFTEFFGANSFAGSHVASDPKQLVLFDVQIEKDFVSPEKFIKDYSSFNIAKLVYQGKYSGQLVEDIRRGKFNVGEGVVIKGMVKDKRYVAKVKTNAYLEKLKSVYKDSWSNYWE